MKILPINLDDLIYALAVESVRLEFKKTYSEPTLEQIIHTICAFANDFHNLNGGYIVIGIEEQNGLPILPSVGLDSQNIDKIQQKIRGNCSRIAPKYLPIISPEIYQGKQILVIWVPASDIRPHNAPIKWQKGKQERAYYVRIGSETIEAKDDIFTQLMQMTAKVPFDDRRNLTASLDDLSPALVRHFLANINCDLVAPNIDMQAIDLYRKLRIIYKVNGHEVPKNVALLFFANQPEYFLQGARIEVVQFGDEAGGDLIEEKIFRGPLHTQLTQVLDYLNAFNTTLIKKVPNQAEAQKMVAFPFKIVLFAHPQYIVIQALRESGHLWAVGERQRAILNLEMAAKNVPDSGVLIAQLIEYKGYLENLSAAEQLFTTSSSDLAITDKHLPFIAIAKIFLDHNQTKKASEILANVPSFIKGDDLMELAVLKKRLKEAQESKI
ncbi:MAG: hypothetical protein DRQ49_07630 [Gammaproteobacteria bacterium]|nr:MAG: hypothetical protein DRQ49_07630 [Gammaproteobacteria bacterium]RKZ44842.1 MAG: hypothetical protein DRQ41_01775 [Gammaproteobacteria bacterium]RKZ76036.1 MAG: hypothetical protein DRQ57_05305 [Gammaproteobacteria bacterium]